MAKRMNLTTNLAALHQRVKATTSRKATPAPKMAAFGVMMPADLHRLLRLVALKRAELGGGRVSVSGVLTALVEGQRAALEAELD